MLMVSDKLCNKYIILFLIWSYAILLFRHLLKQLLDLSTGVNNSFSTLKKDLKCWHRSADSVLRVAV